MVHATLLLLGYRRLGTDGVSSGLVGTRSVSIRVESLSVVRALLVQTIPQPTRCTSQTTQGGV